MASSPLDLIAAAIAKAVERCVGALGSVRLGNDDPMKSLERVALKTIGYEGRTANELIDALKNADVDVLADVRLTPLSRKPGLSKRSLADALEGAGIRYVHLPALGNPRENRDGYRQADQRAVARFRALLQSVDARAALDDLAYESRENVVALLCFERDAHQCHRSLVVEALMSRSPALMVEHI